MEILDIGFTQKPQNMDDIMGRFEFELSSTTKHNGVESRTYHFFRRGKSGSTLTYSYHNGLHGTYEGEGDLQELSTEPIVARGMLQATKFENDFDRQKFGDTARFLRDQYGAILYDPLEQKMISD